MRNKIFQSVLILTLAALPAHAQEYDLQELYKLAKAKDPTVSRAEARLEVGKADKEIAMAALLPRVSANGSIRQIQHQVLYYGKEPINGDYTGFSYGAGAAVSLFNMSSYFQLSAADAGISSADTGLQAARQDLIVRLLDAHLRYLKAVANEKLYRDELTRVGKVLAQSEAFLKAGTGDIIAVYEAKARMDSAAAEMIKTEGILRLALQNLSSLTGIVVDGVKDIAVDKSSGPQPAELEWWVATMQQRSPALLQAKEDLLQAEEYRKAARAGHLPTFSGNGGYTVDKGSTFLPKVETRQWYVGLQMNIPIYSGGETTARTRRALAGEAERRAMFDDAQTQAIRRLKEAYLNLTYNQSLVEAYQRKHESSELQLKAVQKGRDIGTRTAIDLLNAEQTYAISRRDLTSALYDNVQRQIELKAAAGILNEDDLAAVSVASTMAK
ncbi:MAG: TolC family protein [Desulfuromonadaceae bacterium]|nr:TolC family protein [Desulfuromonadaceae bacterium]